MWPKPSQSEPSPEIFSWVKLIGKKETHFPIGQDTAAGNSVFSHVGGKNWSPKKWSPRDETKKKRETSQHQIPGSHLSSGDLYSCLSWTCDPIHLFYLLEIIQTGFLSLSNHRALNYKSTISPLQFRLKLQIFLGEAIPRSKLLLKYKWLTSAPFLRADCDYRFIWKQTGHCNSKGRDNQDLLHQVHKLMIQIQKTWIWSLALPLTGNLLNFSGYPFPHL